MWILPSKSKKVLSVLDFANVGLCAMILRLLIEASKVVKLSCGGYLTELFSNSGLIMTEWTFIEGVSDAVVVLIFTSVLLAFIAYRLVLWLCTPHHNNAIHPAANDQVLTTVPPLCPVTDIFSKIEQTRANIRGERPTPTIHNAEGGCPICLDDVTHGVVTNCGHLFCSM